MERRSSKGTTPRKKYTVDAFEGVEELQDAASDHGLTFSERNDDSAEEFIAAAGASEDEDEISAFEGPLDEDAWAEGSDAGGHILDDSISVVADADAATSVRPNKKYYASPFTSGRYKRRKTVHEGEKAYMRGVPGGITRKASKHAKQLHYFGPSKQDYEPFEQAQTKWGHEPTLPTRQPDKHGFGGLHHSFYQNEETRRKEATDGWEWYCQDKGKEAFVEGQAMLQIDSDEATEFMLLKESCARSFLMGPYKEQRLYHLGVGESMPLTHAWRPSASSNGRGQDVQSSNDRFGFVLNLGTKVQCLDWAPNCPGTDQYLAVALLPTRESEHAPHEVPSAPAFTAQPKHKSCIQLWRFRTNQQASINTSDQPVLELVLCTAWGDVKALEWCQRPREETSTLGLLAVASADGVVRVLDIPLPTPGAATTFVRVQKVAFESKPPSTVCTCITWLSSARLAAGCANGCVAVWDLPTCFRADGKNARPSIYSSISSSYIFAIKCCYPSHPDFLITTSIAGYITLTDLRRPHVSSSSATALSQRSRIAQRLCVWVDNVQIAISVDDNFSLRGLPFRKWFSIIGLGRVKSLATCIAASPCHPFILIGCVNGEVVGTNPIRRLMDIRAVLWQQTWFAHEWRRPTAEETGAVTHANGMDGNDSSERSGCTGLSRITEGYKAENVLLTNDEKALHTKGDGTLYATIYEEPTAITALAWNPNIHVGGWAAAGMADGLLRVEDVSS